MKANYQLYRASFWMLMAVLAAILATLIAGVSKGPSSKAAPTVFADLIIAGQGLSLFSAILLAVLVNFFKKNPVLWFLGAVLFGPIGVIVAYFRVQGLVNPAPPDELPPPPADLTKLSQYRLTLEVEAAEKSGDAVRLAAVRAELARRSGS